MVKINLSIQNIKEFFAYNYDKIYYIIPLVSSVIYTIVVLILLQNLFGIAIIFLFFSNLIYIFLKFSVRYKVYLLYSLGFLILFWSFLINHITNIKNPFPFNISVDWSYVYFIVELVLIIPASILWCLLLPFELITTYKTIYKYNTVTYVVSNGIERVPKEWKKRELPEGRREVSFILLFALIIVLSVPSLYQLLYQINIIITPFQNQIPFRIFNLDNLGIATLVWSCLNWIVGFLNYIFYIKFKKELPYNPKYEIYSIKILRYYKEKGKYPSRFIMSKELNIHHDEISKLIQYFNTNPQEASFEELSNKKIRKIHCYIYNYRKKSGKQNHAEQYNNEQNENIQNNNRNVKINLADLILDLKISTYEAKKFIILYEEDFNDDIKELTEGSKRRLKKLDKNINRHMKENRTIDLSELICEEKRGNVKNLVLALYWRIINIPEIKIIKKELKSLSKILIDESDDKE